MPTNASIIGLLLAGWWLLYFYGANLTDSWFGPFSFDTSELPIITIYAMYIPIFLVFMKRENDLSGFKRYLMPVLAICGSIFMVIAAIFSHGMACFYYIILFAVIIVIGAFRMKEIPVERLE